MKSNGNKASIDLCKAPLRLASYFCTASQLTLRSIRVWQVLIFPRKDEDHKIIMTSNSTQWVDQLFEDPPDKQAEHRSGDHLSENSLGVTAKQAHLHTSLEGLHCKQGPLID